jgi:hypothetical protein
MSVEPMYIVYGGVFKDTTFREIDNRTYEQYGPFETYQEAVNVWRGKMGLNIDICEHRLFVSPV